MILSACGGGGGSGGVAATTSYTIGGTVSGLGASDSVVLQDNNGDNLTVTANGTFTFATKVASGSAYKVTVLTQPAGQTCSVSTGAGTVSGSNVTGAAVVCSTNAYTVGGTVAGLATSDSVVLQDNNGDNLTVTANGAFTFATKVASGSAYKVTVLTQPAGQTCSVSTGAGTVSGSNVTNVAVVCSANAYTVGGTVSGLAGTLVLQDNNGDNLTVTANGAFTFATPVAYTSPYSVTVFTQPAGQGCAVASGTGAMGAANVSNVAISCGNVVGGSVQGIALNLASATVSTLAGSGASGAVDGTGTAASFNWATGTTTDGTNMYVVENCGVTNDIRKIEIATGVVTTLAGSAAAGSADGIGTAATFNCPWGITTDGNALYVADDGNNEIRRIAPSSGTLSAMTSANAVVTTLAGSPTTSGAADGTGMTATFNGPSGITTDRNALYVVDEGNRKIRKIAPSSGTLSAMTSANAVVSSITGPANTAATSGAADGTGTVATFSGPKGITTDGTSLYVVDDYNNKIRKIAPSSGTLSAMTSTNAVVSSITGAVNTALLGGDADGAGTAAMFWNPVGITTDGTSLYVVDTSNNKIRKIAPSSGTLSAMTSATAVVSSVTGGANTMVTAGATNGPAATASFNMPYCITTDGSSLYVTDTFNNLIRKIQ